MKKKRINKLAQSVIDSVTNKVSPSILTKVIFDWQNYFSELKRYKSSQKLLKQIGPVVFGIELEKYLSDEYRPRIVLYNLIDNSNKLIAVIDQTIKNKKGLDISIKYSQHTDEYRKACELLEQQSEINLFDRLPIEEIIKSIVAYIENDSISNCFWSCQAVMQLSRLIECDQKRDAYFAKGLELIKKKIPVHIMDIQTKGTEKWINSIKNLNINKIDVLINENLRRYKMEDIPSY